MPHFSKNSLANHYGTSPLSVPSLPQASRPNSNFLSERPGFLRVRPASGPSGAMDIFPFGKPVICTSFPFLCQYSIVGEQNRMSLTRASFYSNSRNLILTYNKCTRARGRAVWWNRGRVLTLMSSNCSFFSLERERERMGVSHSLHCN